MVQISRCERTYSHFTITSISTSDTRWKPLAGVLERVRAEDTRGRSEETRASDARECALLENYRTLERKHPLRARATAGRARYIHTVPDPITMLRGSPTPGSTRDDFALGRGP